jgi:biotin carboxyl carrier protein
MQHYKIKTNGIEYEVHIHKVVGNTAQLTVNDVNFEVEIEGFTVNPARPVTQTKTIPAEIAAIKQNTTALSVHDFKAPLPGVILNICVKEGDGVKQGDVLLILESMKMENSIQAERDGVVQKILRSKGDAILEGDVILTY